MFKMEFSVISRQTMEAAKSVSSWLKQHNAQIIDLRTANIIEADTQSKVGDVYIYVCRAKRKDYFNIKKLGNYNEMMYEGRKTLF